ncbi:MAG: TetR/AcrR family transcriptional regulator [Exiguobacterium marinum]|uniref:TetR/AcrR family transcriptional regulator n=1 Tax=Exiguobacterium TaxID=33986 RepID=UPI001BEA16D2|nr:MULTISPECIES: TetR/AcrR family transcriptional regulator [unclassified Exiguobacterium]
MNKTQINIVNIAIDVLSRNESASMETIAEQANVSRMTIHRYFKSRERLFSSIHEVLIERTLVIFNESMDKFEDPLVQMESIIRTNAGNHGFHLLFREHGNHEEHDPETCKFSKVNEVLYALIGRLRDAGHINSSIPDAWVFHMYDGVLLMAWEALHNGTVAPREIPDLAWNTFKKGLLS